MKTCKMCGKSKPLEDFHNRKTSKDGKQARCKTCAIEKVREWQRSNPEKHYANVAKHTYGEEALLKRKARKYGLKPEELDALIKQAGGVCNLCERPPHRYLVVDHCHKTGVIRGILCEACNQGLGLFEDNPEFLKLAAQYLEKQKEAKCQVYQS